MLFGENAIRRPADRSSQNHASLTRYVYHHEKSRSSWLVKAHHHSE
jgi:sarcosine oxidase delta subunit